MTMKETAPHGRGMAWATLLVAGGISLGVNLWHAFDKADTRGHGHLTLWFAALAVMYGTAPVVLAAFQSHSAAFVPMGKFRLGLTYVLMVLGMALSIRAQAAAVEPFAGQGWRWVFPVVVDLSAIQALITLMISARAMARASRPAICMGGPHGTLPLIPPTRKTTSVASPSVVAGASVARQDAVSGANAAAVVAPSGANASTVLATTGDGVGGQVAASGAPVGGASGGSEAAEVAPVPRQRQPRSGGAKSRSGGKRTRRSMTEWVELAEPLWHEETSRLRRQPTGAEFAEAIGRAGLGKVSPSTAKNIRMEILDRQDVPALDDLAADQ